MTETGSTAYEVPVIVTVRVEIADGSAEPVATDERVDQDGGPWAYSGYPTAYDGNEWADLTYWPDATADEDDRRTADVSETAYDAVARALDAIAAIHAELDGNEWSADTLDAIAAIIRETGREIGPPE